MIQIWQGRLANEVSVSICCGCTPDREYLMRRCWAEMEADLWGLPVELLCGFITDEEWNESKAKNAAATMAADKIIFTNCDAVIPRPAVETILQECPDNRITTCLRDDEQPDRSLLANDDAMGEFQAVTKKLWERSGGFDERLTGWGYIDYSFLLRCRRVGAEWGHVNGTQVKHCWHPRLTDAEYREMNKRNREISGL